MKFTKIPADTFKEIQLNAGVFLRDFNPVTGAINVSDIIGATSGGSDFKATPSYEDLGSDVDNCPHDTMELKQQTGVEVTMAGTMVTVTAMSAKDLIGAADIDSQDSTHIIPRRDLKLTDYKTVWWVGDYSDKNGNNNGGYVAIKMSNTLSTGGFQIKSNDKGKGQMAFTYKAHYSLNNPDKVPYDLYIKQGESESGDYEMNISSSAGSTVGYTAVTASETPAAGESYVYQTGADLYIPSEGSTLVGSAWTPWDGEDEIEADTGLNLIIAIIDSENKSVHAGITNVIAKES